MKPIFTTILLFIFILIATITQAQTITFGYTAPTTGSPPSFNETCMGYTVYFEWTGLSAQVDYFEIPLRNSINGNPYRVHVSGGGNYQEPAPSPTGTSIIPVNPCPSGSCGRIQFQVPGPLNGTANDHDGPISGKVIFYDVNGVKLDSTTINIANPEVGMGALPLDVCSESTLPLSGTPKGGTFSISSPNTSGVQYLFTSNSTAYTADTLFIPGNNIPHFNDIAPAAYKKDATIQYEYFPVLSDSTVCPVSIISQQTVTVRDNRNFTLSFDPANATNHCIYNSDVGGVFPGLVWNNIGNTDVSYNFTGLYVSTTCNGYLDYNAMAADGANSTNVTLTLNNGGCISQGTGNLFVDVFNQNFKRTFCVGDPVDTFDRYDVFQGVFGNTFPQFQFGSGTSSCSNGDDNIFIATSFDCGTYSSFTHLGEAYDVIYQGQTACCGCTDPYNIIQVVDADVGGTGNQQYSIHPDNIPLNTDVTIYFGFIDNCGSGSGYAFRRNVFEMTVRRVSAGINDVPDSLDNVQNIFCHNDPPIRVDDFDPVPTTLELYRLAPNPTGPIAGAINNGFITLSDPSIHSQPYTDADFALYYEGGACGDDTLLNFTVKGLIEPRFVDTDTAYEACRNDGAEILDPFPEPSTGLSAYFTGGAWVDSVGTFYPFNVPNLATTANITYTYTSIYGCTNDTTITMTIFDRPTLNFTSYDPVTNDSDNEYCANDTVGILQGTVINANGPFTYTYSGPTIGPPPDSVFNPSLIYNGASGTANYTYSVVDAEGCTADSTITITINAIPQPILPADTSFCESDPPVILTGTPTLGLTDRFFYIASGNGNDTLNNDIYTPNPGYPTTLYTVPQIDTIVFQIADSTPCIGRDTQLITVVPNPVVTFTGIDNNGNTTNESCFGVDTLTLTPSSTSGDLNFFGPGVLFNTDQFVPDVAGAGPHEITLIYTDTANAIVSGCRDTFVDTFYVYSQPNVNYTVNGGCGGVDLIFVPDNANLGLFRTIAGTNTLYDSITMATWDFGDGTMVPADDSVIGNANTIDSISYQYATPGVYNTTLFVENRGYCRDSAEVRVIVLPTTNLSPTNFYEEDFEASDGGWIEEAEVGNQSSGFWEHGVATGNNIKTSTDPLHNNVWATDLDAPYQGEQAGWVYSPCFNLDSLKRPMIALDYMINTELRGTGVVIEYYNPFEQRWKNLGKVGNGIDWYNEPTIFSSPGSQTFTPGWSGDTKVPGTSDFIWKRGALKLDQFIDYTSFRFRVAFESSEGINGDKDGFAFDNVFIGERRRNVLLEHFANVGMTGTNNATATTINNDVYNLIYGTYLVNDVVLAQYQLDQPSYDEFNNQNTSDPSARENFYSVPGAGYAVIDGSTIGALSPRSQDLEPEMFEQDMLEDPKFDISIDSSSITNSNVYVRATIEANETMPLDNYYVIIAVIEDSLTYFTGQQVNSVVRKLLPSASGRRYTQSWAPNDVITLSETYALPSNITSQNVEILVWIQRDASTKEVFQVESTRDLSIYDWILPTGTQEVEDILEDAAEVNTMSLYPNPAQDYVNVGFDDPLSKSYKWQVVDLRGVVLRNGTLEQGQQQLQVENIDWASGMYLFVVYGDGFRSQRKLVITRP